MACHWVIRSREAGSLEGPSGTGGGTGISRPLGGSASPQVLGMVGEQGGEGPGERGCHLSLYHLLSLERPCLIKGWKMSQRPRKKKERAGIENGRWDGERQVVMVCEPLCVWGGVDHLSSHPVSEPAENQVPRKETLLTHPVCRKNSPGGHPSSGNSHFPPPDALAPLLSPSPALEAPGICLCPSPKCWSLIFGALGLL